MRAYFIKSLVGLLDEAPIIHINISRRGNKVIASPSSGLRWEVNVAHWPNTNLAQIGLQAAPECFEPLEEGTKRLFDQDCLLGS